jgi:hypothetical protein
LRRRNPTDDRYRTRELAISALVSAAKALFDWPLKREALSLALLETAIALIHVVKLDEREEAKDDVLRALREVIDHAPVKL